MKLLPSINLKSMLAASMLVLAAAPAFAQSPDRVKLTPEQKQDVLNSMERVLTRSAFVPGVDFSTWPNFISEQEDALKNADTPEVFVGIVNTALNKFGFSHITLFPPSFGEQRMTQKRGGIGIRIEQEEKGLRVVFVFPGSPAEKAGLHPGDLVFESDGKQVRSVTDLSGEIGDKSSIKIDRAGKILSFDVVRDEYSTRIPETLTWVNPETALISIPTFDQGYDPETVNKIMAEAKDAKTMILDLRQNGGGRVLHLQHLMGFFLDRDNEPLGTFISRQTIAQYEKEHGHGPASLTEAADSTDVKVRAMRYEDGPFKGNIAVLISGATGSASEMAAAALRDYRGARLIGTKSAGAVLASMMMPLQNAHGFWIQYPVTDYVTIKGLRLEGNGLTPDAIAEIPRFAEPDKAVQEALSWAKTAKRDGN